MTESDPDPGRSLPNAGQVAYWSGDVGAKWVRFQDDIDIMFGAVTTAALEGAAPRPGERVIDIGCGCGATVVALAHRVGTRGEVVGVDVSEVMLARAAERTVGLGQVRLLKADAATWRFAPDADLVFSRFGVMFFDDPASAFRNIHSALAPSGRLVVAVWRGLADNEWGNVPLSIALPFLPQQSPADPLAPGPLALADPDRVRGILSEAGFSAIAVEPRDLPIRLSGAGEASLAAARALKIGFVARAIADVDLARQQTIEMAIRAEFEQRQGPDGLTLGGGIWLVSAKR